MKNDIFKHMKFPAATTTERKVCEQAVNKGWVSLPSGVGVKAFGEMGVTVLKDRLRVLRANAAQCAKTKFDGKCVSMERSRIVRWTDKRVFC